MPPISQSDTQNPAATPRRRRALRWLAWLLAAVCLALAAVWIWAGSEGSLAAALRWAAAAQPISAEGVSGSLRGAGQVRLLVWQQGGLRVAVHDAQWSWSPAALLTGTLQIDRLHASRIEIDDRSPAAPAPPQALALPIKLQVRDLQAGELHWAGPPQLAMQDIAGRFDYDGARHLLTLDKVRAQGGLYSASAVITAHAPLAVQATLTGTLAAPPPDDGQPLPLTLQATLNGTLDDLRAQAGLRLAQPAPGGAAPQARISARITPWAAQPLPQAHASVQALDLAALWPPAPRTDLTGQLELTPLPGTGWAVQADLINRASGPWNQRLLPASSLQADLTWAGGALGVRALKAQIGGGVIESTGRWSAQANTASGWRIDARLAGIDPAQLDTRLAALPVDGTASAASAGAAIDFSAALQARAYPPRHSRASSPRHSRAGGNPFGRPIEAAPLDSSLRGNDETERLRALDLRDLQVQGSWDAGQLVLDRLRVRTASADLSGSARINTIAPGGSADLRLSAPGALLTLKGDAQPGSGGGALHASVIDAARLLAWARPWAGGALDGIHLAGRATLSASWRGGWRDPSVQARLSAPQLDWQPPQAAAADAQLWQARALHISVAGKLAQAEISLDGRVAHGQRQADLRLSASGGSATPGAPLAQSAWRARIGQLQATLRDPALGNGNWHIASRQPVTLDWSPKSGGQFDASAGQLALTSTSAGPAAQALIAWEPAHWRAGNLRSAGRVSGLPLQWIDLLSGARLAQAGIGGDAVFDGGWDAAIAAYGGGQPRVAAHLQRASGDITLLTTDADTGSQPRVAAGLRAARLTLDSQGPAIDLQLKWDSANAGTLNASLHTTLEAANDGAAWHWPASAPLQGQVQARLPQLPLWQPLAAPGWRMRGALALDARIHGTRAAPLLDGSLSAGALALRSVADGVQFDAGRLRARLDGTRLLIDEFVLHGPGGEQGAGGLLRASGQAGWIDGRAQARLSATLEQLRASVRADREVTVSGQLQTALDGRRISVNGQLRVDKARIVLPDQSAPSLDNDVIVRGANGRVAAGKNAPGALAEPPRAGGAPGDAPAPAFSAAAQVQIDLGDDFRLRGMGIDTRLAGALTLTADGPLDAMPRLAGSVRTAGGTFLAYGQQLTISHGNFIFGGDAANPTLDVIALRPNYASEQRAGVQVMGSALLPRVRLYAQPALPGNETLAWLLLGRPAPATGAESAMLQSAALAILGGRQARPLAARLGLDELRLDGAQQGTLADTSVTLGKRLSERLYAAYEHSLSGIGATLLVFYELSPRWSLRGQAGGNQALDLMYRLSFD